MPTGMTSSRTGIPLVNLDKRAPVPRRFVLEQAHERSPADIMNRFCQRRVLGHYFHAQTLDADRLVLTDQSSRELMQEVLTTISNSDIDACNLPARLVAILRAAYLSSKTPLRPRQLLLFLLEVAWVANLLTAVQDYDIMQAQI